MSPTLTPSTTSSGDITGILVGNTSTVVETESISMQEFCSEDDNSLGAHLDTTGSPSTQISEPLDDGCTNPNTEGTHGNTSRDRESPNLGTLACIEKQLGTHSPIQRLPIEVLSEIFYFCLPCSTFVQPSLNHAPLLVTNICTLWRQVCISTPRLWNSLCIPKVTRPPSDEDTDTPTIFDELRRVSSHLSMTQLWLERSRDTPLRIRAKIRAEYFDLAIWKYISCFRHRWEKVDFDFSKASNVDPFDSDPVYYPALKSLCIRNPTLNGVSPERYQNLSNALKNAPLLHDFAWELPRSIPFDPSHFTLDWSRITRLVIHHAMSAQECYTILSQTPNIASLTLNQIYLSPTVASAALTLPYLTSLGLTFDEDITPEYLFDTLSLPALKDLLISTLDVWPKHSYMSFLERSKCQLESLNFYHHPLTESDLIEYLSANETTLTEITIQGYRGQVTDTLLEKLTDNGTDPVWCPKLQIIAIYNALACSPGSTAQMARSRLDSTSVDAVQDSQPRRLSLRVMECYQSESEVQYLEELRELGLVLIQYDDDGNQLPFDKEDVERLRRYRKEGLVLHSYASQIGFGPTETEEL